MKYYIVYNGSHIVGRFCFPTSVRHFQTTPGKEWTDVKTFSTRLKG